MTVCGIADSLLPERVRLLFKHQSEFAGITQIIALALWSIKYNYTCTNMDT